MKFYFALLLFTCAISVSCQTRKKNETMKKKRFEPMEFNDIKLGLSERQENICTPDYPNTHLLKMSQVKINVPTKVFLHKNSINDSVSIIPLCGIYLISNYRATLYKEELATIHMKKDDINIWQLGIIGGKEDEDTEEPLPIDWEDVEEKERQNDIDKANLIPVEDIDSGQGFGSAMNINILEFVNIPVLPGTYEVYVTMYGVESNHEFINVVCE